nr:hypothetical protein [Tanacetum cinerariifolium]
MNILLKFNSIKDAKQLLEVVEKRFGRIAATKKTQRNLLKEQYEKLHSFKLRDEDVNQKLLKSLSLEWNTHVVVWRNKVDLETMSMDDLYNNLKVYEPEVKGMSSSSSSTQNIAFVSSLNNSSTNKVVNTAQAVNTANGVFTASTQVNAAFSTNINNLSDAVICAFLASQYNSPYFAHEDLEQIHLDNMEEMDLRWQKKDLTMHSWHTHLQVLTQRFKVSRRKTDFFKKNEFIYLEDIKVLKVKIQIKDIAIKELRRKLEVAQKEKRWNSTKGNENYNAVSPPYTGNFMPLKPVLSFTGLDEFANKHVAENTKSSEEETKAVRKNADALIIKEWGNPQMDLQDKGVIDNGCSRHMTENMSYLTDYEEIDERYVAFRENPKERKTQENVPLKLDDGFKPSSDDGKKVDEDPRQECECKDQEKEKNVNNTNNVITVSLTVNVASTNGINVVGELPFDLDMPALEDISTFDFSNKDEDDDVVADMNNLDTTIQVSPALTTRIHKDHPFDQLQEVWSLVDLPNRKRAIGTKWVFMNKKDKRGIMIRNKARLVAQDHRQEEGVDYDEVFAIVARIEAIRLFLAYDSFKDFVVYQMDVRSAFFMGRLKKRCMYVNHQDLKIQTFLIESTREKIDKTLFIKRHKGDILLVQVYVDDIIFGSTRKELCIAFEKLMHEKFQMSSMGELTFFLGLQDEDGEEVNVHTYTSIIGSLMYLTSSRPDIIFAVCACARYQVNPKVSHLHAIKRIFRYLKGHHKLGLWYPKDSPFDLVANTDSDYAGASLDRKSTTRGCQYLGSRLISWQCKKHRQWLQIP